MKARVTGVTSDADSYDALLFVCPGCATEGAEVHVLPVSGDPSKHPVWDFDGNLEAPTLSPSILTRTSYYTGPGSPPREFVCHSHLRAGVFEFLSDCTHALAGQRVPMPELPDWLAADT